jgi:hypothetical protein
MNVPKPSPSFIKKRDRLKSLMVAQSPSTATERRKLEAELRAEFIRAFDLEPDKGCAGMRFYDRHQKLFNAGFWDHQDWFRRGPNLVVVGQPYGFDRGEFIQWLDQTGADGADASEWSFHYPGQTRLLIAEFTPEAGLLQSVCIAA